MPPTLLTALLAAYRTLLRTYPRPMQAAFGSEMEGVFRQALTVAGRQGTPALVGLCLRELRDWPAAVWRAHVTNWPRAEERTPMLTTTETAQPEDRTRASWAGTFAGALPFVLFGLASALHQLPGGGGGYLSYTYAVAYLLILAGLVVGWVRGFPRWALIYLGWGLFGIIWWWSGLAFSPLGLRLGLNLRPAIPLWAAVLPLALAVAASLLICRSLQPLRALAARLWRDWTWLSLSMYIFMAWVMLLFEMNHHPYLVPLIVAATVAAAVGAMLYLRGASVAQRGRGLLAGLMVIGLITALADNTWDWHTYYGLAGTPPAAWRTFLQSMLGISVWGLVMLGPALWQWLRQQRRADLAPQAPAGQ